MINMYMDIIYKYNYTMLNKEYIEVICAWYSLSYIVEIDYMTVCATYMHC